MTHMQRAFHRRQTGRNYPAWLIDADGRTRKFWGASYDEAYALAKAAGERAKAKVRAAGFTPQDRFHVAIEGVTYNISLDA
jgi:hypothetical protein